MRMGLFGFGKKKEEQQLPQKQKEQHILNRRAWIRYNVTNIETKLGTVIDIAKRSISIVTSGKYEVGEKVEVDLDDICIAGEIVAISKNRLVVALEEEVPQRVIKKYLAKLDTCACTQRSSFDFELLKNDENVKINKAIVHLMLEIEDPNTTIEQLENDILAIPKLEETILKRANSIEKARAARITSVRDAIARLGFEEIKLMVYDYINYDLNLSNTTLEKFRNFDVYNLLINALFKRLAPLFGFNDVKAEGQSLMGMSYVGAMYLAQQSPKLQQHYSDVDALFSYEMRLLEYCELGQDLFALNRYYFLDILNVFTYLYDGIVLAYMTHQPHYKPTFTVTLSQRKLKFSYIAYLTILAMRYILGHDKHSGYVVFNRLKRFGYDLPSAKDFLNSIVDEVNGRLQDIGADSYIRHCQIPTIMYSLEEYLGSGTYYEYFRMQIDLLKKGHKRFVIGYDDEVYTHFVMEKIFNYDEYELHKLPFAVIDCSVLADEDLMLDQFESFDLLLFKNIHSLPKHLEADFFKIYRDFEGILFATFANEAMIDYSSYQLYSLVREDIVQFPDLQRSAISYVKMVQNAAMQVNRFAQMQLCDIAEFKNTMMRFECIEKECIQKL